MPSFPQPGVVTVCEINRDIITAESLSDELAKDTYGKILGVIFSPVPFQLEASNVEQVAGHEPSDAAPTGGFARLKEIVAEYTNRIFFPNEVRYSTMLNMLADIDTQRVNGKDPCFLTSEFQRDIKTLEWRPNSGMMLAVGCRGGICIWSASFPGNSASVRYEITSSVNSVSGGPGVRWMLVDFLQSSNSELTSILSWSPNGRYPFLYYRNSNLTLTDVNYSKILTYLASSSYGSSSFTVWDVSQGVGTAIRRGLGPLSMLKWSPSGDYFLTAKLDGTFYLWETITWTSEPWSSTTGYVTGVAWDPEGQMILISFSESVTLGAIHFASKPPSLGTQYDVVTLAVYAVDLLAAHLVPLEMPELASLSARYSIVSSLTVNGLSSVNALLALFCRGIEKMAWDASGERLALSFKDGDEMYNGLIAIYDTRTTPLVSASLVGFIRGPGEKPKPLAFAFHKFKQGPILSVTNIKSVDFSAGAADGVAHILSLFGLIFFFDHQGFKFPLSDCLIRVVGSPALSSECLKVADAPNLRPSVVDDDILMKSALLAKNWMMWTIFFESL
ncbi:hypothetical protein ZIOFF_010677 [Zingiber officinale]|uniref:Aladin n=1 Tax=Zingiber officinale TaxID=94328 RepID=A0A8J5I126_ZINOF|nr:hypothetical protein ZIOFF_010677 [Zingiber officinale]